MSSGTPNRTRLFPTGRIRSLSLEESNDDPAMYSYDLGNGNDAKDEEMSVPRRRFNTYLGGMQRSLEETVDEDQQGEDIPFSESMSGSLPPTGHQATSLIARSELAIFNFLQRHPCYELMPHSSKLVVFDTRLSGRKAFFAMMHNGVSSALLWSTEKQTYVGVLTVCDFIRAMCHQYNDGGIMIEEQCIDAWLKVDNEKRRMITVGPEDSLARATSMLLAGRMSRLPVCDPLTGNVLCTIAHKHIVRLVYANLSRLLKPRSWFRTLSEVGIGTFGNLATVTPQTKVIDALRLLIDRHISGIPVVSAADNRLIGVFSHADALVLAIDKAYMNLDRPLSEILPHLDENTPRPPSMGPLRTCTMEETLGTIVERLVRGLVHRLVIVDSARTVLGVVSLSDLLRFFIRAPPSSMFLQSPGGSVTTPVLFTASGYDLLNAPSFNQFPITSQSLLSATSPLSFVVPNGTLTPTSSARHQHHSVRLEPSYEDEANEDNNIVSASLPAVPGPAHRLMAFADIAS